MSASPAITTALPRFKRYAQVSGAIALVVGVLVLLGWLLNVGTLKSVLPGWVSVKPNTALSFLLIGLALLLSRSRSKLLTRASRICAVLAGVIGLLSLCEYAFGWNLRLDQWLFSEPAGTIGTSSPGRMAPESAFCFVLLAGAELIATSPRKTYWSSLGSAVSGLLVTTLAVASILCYLTPILGVYGWWGLTIMAVPTAATFAVLGIAVILTTWQWDVSLWSLSKNSTVMFAIGLALLVLIGLNISRSQFRLRETGGEVAHRERVLTGIANILALVARAQNHTRGFVITGDQRFLHSFNSAVTACNAALNAQRQLAADDPAQLQQFALLEAHVKTALQWSPQVFDASRRGVAESRRRETVSHGEDVMDALRATFQQIETENQQSLQSAKLDSERVAALSYSITSIGTLMTLVIFLLALFGLNQAEAARKQTVAELQEKSQEIAAMTQQLWQASKLATMGELAASVAHELNNPLATIALRTEHISQQLPETDGARSSAQIILNEVERMAQLVSNLLQFSRRSHRQVSTVNVAEEISNSVSFISYYLRNRKVTILFEFATGAPLIQADRQQLRQLFLNLLTNAADAMPVGGPLTTRVSVADLNGAPAVQIEFVDTGVGIPRENLDRIWDSFFTTKPEGKGTGLGLAICRRIVEEHRGTIEIDSEVGQGTTVRIVLPVTTTGTSPNSL